MLSLVAIMLAAIAVPVLLRMYSEHERLSKAEFEHAKRAMERAEAELEKSVDPATLPYSEQEFAEMVSRALDDIPEEFDKEWENVAVIVSTGIVSDADRERMKVPKGHLVLGKYTGVDRTKGQWSQASRHIITIYQRALEQRCGANRELLEQEVRRTVLHELAHHLGMKHERMREIGL